MPSKFYEYLIANGASAEEAKVLDTPLANKIHEQNLAREAAQQAALEEAQKQTSDYQDAVNKWYGDANAKLVEEQNKGIAAAAEAAKYKAALLTAQEKGLFNVAKDLGWQSEPEKKEPEPKYLTEDKLTQIADSVGDNLARMQDFVGEFSQLFPGRRLNMQAERKEAVAAGRDFYSHVENKYKMAQARTDAAQKEREAEIAKWKAEGAKEKETELVSKFGNPMTRPAMPSHKPIFAARSGDGLREGKHPWDQTDGALANDRVARATQKEIERQYKN